MNRRTSTAELAETALFVAIIALLSLVPGIGYIPLGPINATIVHIPVILGGVLFGWRRGAFLGGVFGLTSVLTNTFRPNASSFVFSPFIPVLGSESGSPLALVVALLPRILIGVVAALVFEAFRKKDVKRQTFGCALAGFLGSMTNTVLVMGGIYLFFGRSYSEARGVAYEALLATISSIVTGSGLVEALVAMLLTAAVGAALLRFRARRA